MKNKLSPLDIAAQHKLGVTFSAHARGGVTLMPRHALNRAADRHMAANSSTAPALRAA